MNQRERDEIRKRYRVWRALAGMLTQDQVEEAARKIYPEFRRNIFYKFELGQTFPSPTERKALARVLKVAESELPSESVQEAKAS